MNKFNKGGRPPRSNKSNFGKFNTDYPQVERSESGRDSGSRSPRKTSRSSSFSRGNSPRPSRFSEERSFRNEGEFKSEPRGGFRGTRKSSFGSNSRSEGKSFRGEKSSRFERTESRSEYKSSRPVREERGYRSDRSENSDERQPKREFRTDSSFGERKSGERSFDRGNRGGSGRGGRFGGGGSRFGGGRRNQGGGKTRNKLRGSTINIDQLINKVSEESFIKPTEHVIEHKFDDFKMDPRLKANIKRKGFISPTPIQDKAIPLGLEGRDVIGLANTGQGKTAAFLIPILNKMLDNKSEKALIIAPTRELAQQINEELFTLNKGFNLFSVLCIGGTSMGYQAKMVQRPFNFIVGTPGRIIDLMNRKMLKLDNINNIVLDECDRMVDMGFIDDIKLILSKLPRVRQSFFFTATMGPKIEEVVRSFMVNPEKVSVKMRETSGNIEQDIIHAPKDFKKKLGLLIEVLLKPDFDKVLIFGRTKSGVEKIQDALIAAGLKSDYIHGDKSQAARKHALERFKKNLVNILVATDVAARGLDIKNVSHVINFDLPANYEEYVHRIGRTGRADKKGVALTFVPSN